VVDQSLLRRAADRGVTICFADLDGAEGLWVPEERTVLVNRGLSEAKAAEVIEHELAHVMIDDQHADLDAGKDVLSGHPPTRSWRSETVALAAAVGLIAVVGGAVYGINATRGDVKRDQVAPNNGPGLTASESADGTPSTRVRLVPGPDGRLHTVVVTESASAPTAPVSPTASPTASATATKAPQATAPPRTTVPPSAPPTSSATPPGPPTTEPPPTTPTPDPTTPPPTSPVAPTAGAGDTGDQGGAGGSAPAPGPTEPATVASIASDFPPADGTVESPADSPAGGALDGAPDSTTGG